VLCVLCSVCGRVKRLNYKCDVFDSVKEEVFWRNYFYRVSLVKQSAQLTALAAQQQQQKDGVDRAASGSAEDVVLTGPTVVHISPVFASFAHPRAPHKLLSTRRAVSSEWLVVPRRTSAARCINALLTRGSGLQTSDHR